MKIKIERKKEKEERKKKKNGRKRRKEEKEEWKKTIFSCGEMKNKRIEKSKNFKKKGKSLRKNYIQKKQLQNRKLRPIRKKNLTDWIKEKMKRKKGKEERWEIKNW